MLPRMMRRLPLVLHDRDLPAVELRAAALDGELAALGDAWAVTDSPTTASARAASLAWRVPPRGILSDRSAAWVWGWSPVPAGSPTAHREAETAKAHRG